MVDVLGGGGVHLWGFLWVNDKLNCALYPVVCFFIYIEAWVT